MIDYVTSVSFQMHIKSYVSFTHHFLQLTKTTDSMAEQRLKTRSRCPLQSPTCFVFRSQLALREVDIERDKERASGVVVLVVGHSFILLSNASTGPRHLAAFYYYLVTVEMVYLHCEARQRVDQSNCHVCVQVITAAFKQRMSATRNN